MFSHLLDQGIYTLVKFAYQVFYYIANASILNPTIVQNFTTRMYALLGIIMVFVLAFNLLSYIVDPDKITDKKAGASTFVKDVILAIVIIAASPMLFTKLYSLQSKILTSGVLSNLILGGATEEAAASDIAWQNNKGSYNNVTEYYIDNGGNSMIASVYTAFLYPVDGSFTALDCGKEGLNDEQQKYCDAYQEVKTGGSLTAFDDFITNDDYNFVPFLTTIAGIVLLFFMLSFCINLAKRVGKMAIIQLIAPVPVTLELLPNKKGLRDNWLKTLGQVYIEVFFNLAVMYIIIMLISLIPGTVQTLFDNAAEGFGPAKLFATVLLIYGLLMFGKEAPQMLFDLLGIKSTGKIKEAAMRGLKMAGSLTAGVGTAATTMTRNGYGAIQSAMKKDYKGAAAGVAGMVTGGVSGLARGMYANRSGGFKNIKATTSRAVNETNAAQRKNAQRLKDFGHNANLYGQNINTAYTSGSGLGKAIFEPLKKGVTEGPVGNWATGRNSYSALNEQISAMNKAKGYFKNVTTGFGPYEDATRMLNEAKAKTNYAQDFSAWKTSREAAIRAANPTASAEDLKDLIKKGTKEKDFIATLSGNPDYNEVVNAYAQQQNLRDTRINSKENEIINNALGALQYIDLNPQIALSEKAKAERDKLRSLIDEKGNIASGKTIKDVYTALDDLSTRLGDDITIASRSIERQKIIEEAKKNGNSGSSSGK